MTAITLPTDLWLRCSSSCPHGNLSPRARASVPPATVPAEGEGQGGEALEAHFWNKWPRGPQGLAGNMEGYPRLQRRSHPFPVIPGLPLGLPGQRALAAQRGKWRQADLGVPRVIRVCGGKLTWPGWLGRTPHLTGHQRRDSRW